MRLAALFLALAFPIAASATEYHLRADGTGDWPDIQTAVDSSAAGDTLSLADGNYTGPGNGNVELWGKNLVIRSESDTPEACVIDLHNNGRAFLYRHDEDSTSVLEGLVIANAGPSSGNGGAVYCAHAWPSIRSCVFRSCEAGRGGAIYLYATDPVTLEVHDCVFEDNSVGDSGGACYGGRLAFHDCCFTSNSAEEVGGAVYTAYGTFDGCVFTLNNAYGGGAIYSGSASVSTCEFEGNHADSHGGAILANDGAIEDCAFIANTAEYGGAIVTFEGIDLSHSLFWGNSAILSGGDLYLAGDLDATSCTFALANTWGWSLGASVYCLSGNGGVTTDCTFYGCQGQSCVYLEGSAPAFRNTVIAFTEHGTAIECTDSTPTLTCCNIYGNEEGDWTGDIREQLGLAGNIALDPWFCTPDDGDFHLHEDSPCVAYSDPNPECDQIGAWPAGCLPMGIGADPQTSRITAFGLSLLSDNPARGGRVVFQSVAGPAGFDGTLTVYDATGRRIANLHSGRLSEGAHTHTWDCRDSQGRPVSPGVYFARLGYGLEGITRCVVLIR